MFNLLCTRRNAENFFFAEMSILNSINDFFVQTQMVAGEFQKMKK